MKDFLRILRRFVPPYKKFMVWNVIFNVLSAILNLFSFALIIPILNILFKISDETYTYTDWTFAPFSFEAWKATPELLKNNFFWFVSDMIETKGGSFTLIILGVFLIVSTFLKVGTMYMAFYTMIPIRTGVVRDIRNQINRKITELPLGFFSEERKGDIIARVSGDVNEIETSIMSSLDMLFKNKDKKISRVLTTKTNAGIAPFGSKHTHTCSYSIIAPESVTASEHRECAVWLVITDTHLLHKMFSIIIWNNYCDFHNILTFKHNLIAL